MALVAAESPVIVANKNRSGLAVEELKRWTKSLTGAVVHDAATAAEVADIEAGFDTADAATASAPAPDAEAVETADAALSEDASTPCAGLCPAGFACFTAKAGGPAECLPDGALQCQACAVDANCAGGTCGKVDGEGPFCLVPCKLDAQGASSCAAGSTCLTTETDLHCVPNSGSCTCTAAAIGASKPCIAQGGCAGTRTCGATGWSACVAASPVAEVCDGVDNDCNGKTDDVPAVNLASDATHCGACDKSCTKWQVCSAGVCGGTGGSIPAVGGWITLGADNQHSGAALAEADNLPMTADWSVKLGTWQHHPVAIDGPRLFVTPISPSDGKTLRAYDVATGQLLWQHDFRQVASVGQPTAVGGKVFVGQNNNSPGTFLWVLGAATGKVLHAFPMSAQWDKYWAPLVVGDTVYTNGGNSGGMYAFSISQDQQLFYTGLEPWSAWSPALFGGNIFTFVAGHVRSHDPKTGKVLWETGVASQFSGYMMENAPVFDATQGYVVAVPNLYAFSPSTGAIL